MTKEERDDFDRFLTLKAFLQEHPDLTLGLIRTMPDGERRVVLLDLNSPPEEEEEGSDE